MAMACLVERAPCLPSRMWRISSRTNSPAWVEGALPSCSSCLARSIVCFSGMMNLLLAATKVRACVWQWGKSPALRGCSSGVNQFLFWPDAQDRVLPGRREGFATSAPGHARPRRQHRRLSLGANDDAFVVAELYSRECARQLLRRVLLVRFRGGCRPGNCAQSQD